MANIGDYWDELTMERITELLHEYNDLFPMTFIEMKGISRELGEMNIPLLTGETVHPSTGRVEPVRGCLNNPSRLVWTTLTSLTNPLATLRSRKETKEKLI
jgi:hypothetical protein